MRTSITHTLRTQLEIWRSGKVMRATRGTSHGLHPHTIAGDDHMRWWLHAEGVEDKPGFWLDDDNTAITGDAHTVFVVVPPEQISVYRSVLRVVLGMMLQGVMAHRRHVEREARNGRASFMPEGQWPFLFLFDELPQLGYMRIVEDAVSIARGANIRLWLVAQDLSQFRNVYPRWETLIANSKAQMYFRPNDLGTSRYISELLGEHPDLWGNRAPLAAPHELMGDAFRDDVILRFQGHKPIRARMPIFWDESESAKKMVATAKAHLGDKPAREKEPWPVDGLTLEELQMQNAAMRKQVPEPSESAETESVPSRDEDVERNDQTAEPEREAVSEYELTEDGLPKPPRLD
jgi:type IV secretory pathway TraG/TraD family ATPase VirD4